MTNVITIITCTGHHVNVVLVNGIFWNFNKLPLLQSKSLGYIVLEERNESVSGDLIHHPRWPPRLLIDYCSSFKIYFFRTNWWNEKNLNEKVIGWFPSKIVSVDPINFSRWPIHSSSVEQIIHAWTSLMSDDRLSGGYFYFRNTQDLLFYKLIFMD